ncbi:hypothetical protein P2H44_09735 [Albimonas sp. CAU 1670]|uniref:hypothetical protein n=1 Tax=Albimonas sp. CAU 1670 TaxID=3032599 RepID=UPI0023DA5FA9|nr:hypothetical protein [Albimonas sp. CAU 1670]MDF2232834.1 hypothetical protein [Albimonas sp. CAU 1670]
MGPLRGLAGRGLRLAAGWPGRIALPLVLPLAVAVPGGLLAPAVLSLVMAAAWKEEGGFGLALFLVVAFWISLFASVIFGLLAGVVVAGNDDARTRLWTLGLALVLVALQVIAAMSL